MESNYSVSGLDFVCLPLMDEEESAEEVVEMRQRLSVELWYGELWKMVSTSIPYTISS